MHHENNIGSNKMEISKDLTIPKLFYQQATTFGKDRVAMRPSSTAPFLNHAISWALVAVCP